MTPQSSKIFFSSQQVTRLASKLKSQVKRKALRQTPSPVKVADRVSEIEKKITKKSRKIQLATLEEVSTPLPEPTSAKAQLQFDFLDTVKKNKDFRQKLREEDSEDDFEAPQPNLLCELAEFNRRHAKAAPPAKQKRPVKSKK